MTIHRSLHENIEIPDTAITTLVLRHAERLAERPAMIDGPTGRTVTFGQFAERIRRLASAFADEGVGPGVTWALMAPNSPEYAMIFHGIAFAGGTVTTLNPTYGVREIAHQLKDAQAKVLISSVAFEETAQGAADELGIPVIFFDKDGALEERLKSEPMISQVPVDPGDVVVLPYSSGTTGFPKGVMLTHENLVANVLQLEAHKQVDEGEVCYAVLPFFHIYGMQVLMNFMLARGATVVTVPRFDMVQMLELTQKHEVTRLFLVPPVVLALAKHPIVDKYDMSPVREIFSGAAPLGGELAEAAAARLGCVVGQGYGMTETSPVTHAIQPDNYKAGSIGTLLPNTEARIVHEGNDMPFGERGELWIRGPQVMKGYFGNENATSATIDEDGFIHTGDVAIMEESGHTYIVDRLKELIKVKGFQVAPAELEALLVGHDGIADAAVIGVPDEESGEAVKAFIVRADEELDEDAIKAYVAAEVATYKQLKFVEFRESIPKSASGKILRRELRG